VLVLRCLERVEKALANLLVNITVLLERARIQTTMREDLNVIVIGIGSHRDCFVDKIIEKSFLCRHFSSVVASCPEKFGKIPEDSFSFLVAAIIRSSQQLHSSNLRNSVESKNRDFSSVLLRTIRPILCSILHVTNSLLM